MGSPGCNAPSPRPGVPAVARLAPPPGPPMPPNTRQSATCSRCRKPTTRQNRITDDGSCTNCRARADARALLAALLAGVAVPERDLGTTIPRVRRSNALTLLRSLEIAECEWNTVRGRSGRTWRLRPNARCEVLDEVADAVAWEATLDISERTALREAAAVPSGVTRLVDGRSRLGRAQRNLIRRGFLQAHGTRSAQITDAGRASLGEGPPRPQ